MNFNILKGEPNSNVNLIFGIFIAALVAMVLLGGIKRIGQVSEKLVPFMAVLYVILALGVIILNIQRVPGVFAQIVSGAFTPRAATGGIIGSMFLSMKRVFQEESSPTKPALVPDPSPMPVPILTMQFTRVCLEFLKFSWIPL